jgi:protein-disulfide isomerase
MKRTSVHTLSLAALFSLSLACHRPPSEGDTVVATVNGQPITLGEVDRVAGKDLYKIREPVLQRMINDHLLEDAAKKAGLDRTEYLRQELAKRAQPPTEEDAKGFFERNKEHLPAFKDKTFDEIKPMIMKRMGEERRHRAAGILSEDLRGKADVRLSLHAVVKVDPTGPSRGPATAKVTIVEFTDFQCPVCSQGRKLLERALKEYDGKVRLVFRDFPLPLHPDARKAAEAAHCADEQGKFWEMHDLLFDHPDTLQVEDLKAQARKLGLDGAKFDACLASDKFGQTIDDSIRAGESYGITATPTFFVNGVLMEGVTSYETFKLEIDRALAK